MTVKGTPQNRKRKLSDSVAEQTSAKKAALSTPRQSTQGKKTPPSSAKKDQTPQKQKTVTPKVLNPGNKKPQSATTPKVPTPKGKTPKKAKTPLKTTVKVEDEDLDQDDVEKPKQETGAKEKQNQKTQSKSPEKEVSGSQKGDVDAARKDDRDAKTLFVKNLPGNCSVKEIKALSSDIKQVRLRINTKVYVKSGRTGYAYVEFGSEEAAEKNFPILNEATIRGSKLKVDYVGAKSLNIKGHKPVTDEARDPLKLYLAGLPLDVTEADVRKLFPKAKEIILPIRKKDKKSFGYGFVTFPSPELAKQAHDKSQDVSLKDVTLVVLYAKLKQEKPQVSEKKKQAKKGNKKLNPAEKKVEINKDEKEDDADEEEEMDEENDEDDEDDDEDDEDDDEDDEDDDDEDDEDDDDEDDEDDDDEDD